MILNEFFDSNKKHSPQQWLAEGLDAEAYKQKLLSSLPGMMRFFEKNVQGWRPSREQMLAAIETGYTVMKHTGDVKQAGRAVMDELNTLHRMSQGEQDVAEGKMAELEMDLEDSEITDRQFEKMYGMTRKEAREQFSQTDMWAFPEIRDPNRPLHERGVAEEFGPLPKDNQQIRLGRHTVDIERVGLDKNYISFAWHDSKGQEHYEEVAVGDLGSYDDLIKKIKQEISYQERKYTYQGVAEGANDTIYPNAEVIKSKNGRPVGEIYQDGNSWGCFHYRADRGYDMIDSREDAIQALKDLHQETGRSGPDYTFKGVAEGSNDELNARPGMWRGNAKRMTAKGKPTKDELGMQDNLKNRIKASNKKGGITGPKGPLPEQQGVAEGLPSSLSKSDYTPGKTVKHTSSNCTTCHGRKSMYKVGGKLFPDNKQGATKIKCPTCKGTGDKQGVAETTGDEKFDSMMGKISSPAIKQAQQQRELSTIQSIADAMCNDQKCDYNDLTDQDLEFIAGQSGTSIYNVMAALGRQKFNPKRDIGKWDINEQAVAEAINPDITNPAFSHQQQIGDYLYVARYWSKGLKITAYDGNKKIGYAELMYQTAPFDDFANPKTTPKRVWLESEWTEVDPKYQRQGIMSTMYAYAKMLGNSVKPSELRSPDAKAAWSSWRQAGDAKHLTSEGDDPWGPQGNFAGDKHVDVGGVTMTIIQVGDIVKYLGQKAEVVALSKDRKRARITIQKGMGGITKDVNTSDLTQFGQGVTEVSDATKQSYTAKAQAQVKELEPHAKKGEYRDIAQRAIDRRQRGLNRLANRSDAVAAQTLAPRVSEGLTVPEGRPALGQANITTLIQTYKRNEPFAELSFGKSGDLRINRQQMRLIMDHYLKLQTPEEKHDFVYETMSRMLKLIAMFDGYGIDVRSQIAVPPGQTSSIPGAQPQLFELDAGEVKDTRLSRALKQARAEFPTAGSDIEAFLKLVMSNDDRDLATMDRMQAVNKKQSQLLDRIQTVDQKQNQEINNLESELDRVTQINQNLERELDRIQSAKPSAAADRKDRKDAGDKPAAGKPAAKVDLPVGQDISTKTAKKTKAQVPSKVGYGIPTSYKTTLQPPKYSMPQLQAPAQAQLPAPAQRTADQSDLFRDIIDVVPRAVTPTANGTNRNPMISSLDQEITDIFQPAANDDEAQRQANAESRDPQRAIAHTDFDDPEWHEKVRRVGQRAQQGPLKTVWDPVKRVYRNVPVDQPANKKPNMNEARLHRRAVLRQILES